VAANVIVLYNHPTDPAAFDAYYLSTHAPIAKKMPGLRKYMVSREAVSTPQGDKPYHLIATLEFDSLAAAGTAFGSPEGAAALADIPNFASGGLTVLMYEMQEV